MPIKSKAYLTIDDSPSSRMDDMVDWLYEKSIPAIFFCRGDLLEQNMDSAVRAIGKGFVLANHAYSHQRSSQKSYEWIVDDIERCERLVADAYRRAGVHRSGRYFRFPQLDRGTAGWIVDYDTYPDADRRALLSAFAEGLNVLSMDRPEEAAFVKKGLLQAYLKEAGYSQPFRSVTHRWYSEGEIAGAADCLYTFSNCDWMVTARHIGKWPYKSVADLKAKALADPCLSMEGSVNVILAHDQAEIVDITIELLEDLHANGLEFLAVE